LVSYLKVYNSVGYEKESIFYNWLKILANIIRVIKAIFLGKYNGLSPVDKDHHLLILKKKYV